MRKAIIIPALALALVGGAVTVGSVSAQGEGRPFHQQMIERFADRFGLNQSEVEGFMMEMHDERQANRQANHQKHLDELVADGTLTEEQRQSLEAKYQEMTQDREGHHQEMEDWAEEQGIDLSKVAGRGEGMGKH